MKQGSLLFLHVSFTKSPQFLSPFSGPPPSCLSYQRPPFVSQGILTVDPVLAVVKVTRVNTIGSLSTDVKDFTPPCSPRTCKLLCRKHYLCICNVMCTIIIIHAYVCGFPRSHVLPQPMAHVSKQCPPSLPTLCSPQKFRN